MNNKKDNKKHSLKLKENPRQLTWDSNNLNRILIIIMQIIF